MKKIFLSLILVTAFYNLLAQKTISDLNAEKRTIGSFHGINVATGIKLIITEGSTEEVAVSASKPEYREKIVTEVVNGTLKIYYDKKLGAINKKDESKNLKAYVSYKTLSQLDVTTGAEVEINGILTSSSLDLTANTGGLVKGEINVTTFKVSQNTGSKITLSGKAESLANSLSWLALAATKASSTSSPLSNELYRALSHHALQRNWTPRKRVQASPERKNSSPPSTTYY